MIWRARLHVPRAGFLITVLCALVLASACADPLEFTVVNLTDERLTVWAFEEPCGTGARYKGDYKAEGTVGPGETYQFYDLHGGGSDVECIQAVDEERNLVFEEPYEDAKSYQVSDISAEGDRIPELQTLPSQSWSDSWWESLVEEPAYTGMMTIGLVFGLVMIVAIPYGTYRAIKDLRRQSRQSHS